MYKYTKEVMSPKFVGKEVTLRGWVYRKREQKDIIFILLRDSEGVIQITVRKGTKPFKEAEKLSIESSFIVRGVVKEDKRAPGGFELEAKEIKIIHLAERFPITRDVSKSFLLDVRHLWIRSRKMNSILKVRSKVMKYIREFFDKRGFVEISPPMFVSGACEGGATLFEVKYFDDKVYLTQSWQLYAEAVIFSIDKIYTIAPSFRAEKSRTIRHLTEYWHAEAEIAFADLDDVMKLEEDLLCEICKRVKKECKEELEILKVDLTKFKKVKKPFPRLKYEEVLERLRKKGFKMKFGEDLGYDEEKAIAAEIGGPFFIYAYPKETRAFYCKAYEDNKELVKAVDLLVPRIGELASGSERIDDKEELIRRIKELKMDPKQYEWYIDLRRYGSVPHAGFGLGIERLLAWLLDLESVQDAIPFPRTLTRTYP